jgi:hypothetical protein
MVGPSSDRRLTKQRRESEANGPQGRRPARVSRRGPSWTEFVRLADQAVVAIAGTDMINHAEPRACGHSRGSRRLDPEPETERTAGPASNAAGDGCGRAQDDQAGFQPYWLCGQFSYVAQLLEKPDFVADRAHWAPHNNASLPGSRSTICSELGAPSSRACLDHGQDRTGYNPYRYGLKSPIMCF